MEFRRPYPNQSLPTPNLSPDIIIKPNEGAYILVDGSSGEVIGYYDYANQAIQEAQSLLNDGGTIYLTKGKYYVNNTINLLSNIKLVGAGIGSTIIVKKANIDLIIIGGDGADYVENVLVESVEVDGNNANYTGAGIKVGYSKNITLRDIYIHNNYFHQISILNTSPGSSEDYLPTNISLENVFVNGNTSRTSTEAVVIGGRYVSGHNIWVWDATQGAGIHIYDNTFDRSHDISLSNVHIYSSKIGLMVTAPYNVTVSNIIVKDTQNAAIKIAPNEEATSNAGALSPVHDVNITNAIIENACIAVPAGEGAIVIRNAKRIRISGRVNTSQLPGVRIDTATQWNYTPSFTTSDIVVDVDVTNAGLQGGVYATQTGVNFWLSNQNIENVEIRGHILGNKTYSIGIGTDNTSLLVNGLKLFATIDQGFYNQKYARFFKNTNIVTFTGDGTTTTFSVATGLVATPSKYWMIPLDENAKGYSSITASGTYLVVNFATALGSGSTATFSWYAEV